MKDQQNKTEPESGEFDFPLPALSQTEPLSESPDDVSNAYLKICDMLNKLHCISFCGVSKAGAKPCLKVMLNSEMTEEELKLFQNAVENVSVVFSRGKVRTLQGKIKDLPKG